MVQKIGKALLLAACLMLAACVPSLNEETAAEEAAPDATPAAPAAVADKSAAVGTPLTIGPELPPSVLAGEAAPKVEGPETRIALVISVEDYPAPPGALANPHDDGERMTAALKAAKFDVRSVKDATATEIEAAVKKLSADLGRAGPNGVGFVYFSGHGGSVERNGLRRNYVLPGKTVIGDGQTLALEGVAVADMLEDLEVAQAKAVFVVIDACRNTLPITSQRGGDADKGFVAFASRSGLFVAFAVADGETTPDDGVYATELAQMLRQPGLTHDRAFILANRAVSQRRASGKTPIVSDGLSGDIVFVADAGNAPPPEPPPAPPPATRAQTATPVAATFTYMPPGSILKGQGNDDRTVYFPDIAFPIAGLPSFLGSSSFGVGGMTGGDQCSPANFVYPWYDSFCEERSGGGTTTPFCAAQRGHVGVDIRAGTPAMCQQMRKQKSAEHDQIPVIAVEDGVISNVGSYSVTLRSNSGGPIWRYLHLNMDKLKVTQGQEVKKRDVIGYLSNNFGGTPTTIHLHFEVKTNTEEHGWQYVSPYMSLVRAYERDYGGEGVMLNWLKK